MTLSQSETVKNKSPRPYLYLLTAMYTAGLIGLNIPQIAWLFKLLTPFNLIASLGILLYFHEDWNTHFKIFAVIAFLTGYFIEVVGVNTGLIFGHYQYDTTLGFEILNVPPVIGVNWLMLVYCVGIIMQKQLPYLRVGVGAILLTLFDYVVEPIAIRQEMWSWFGQMPPIQNYIGWFVVSAFLLFLFDKLSFKKENPIARWLFILNILFFFIQHFI
ncbi:MAG: carotenoid biosynthesis protein [Spirosomataceae bacterium]